MLIPVVNLLTSRDFRMRLHARLERIVSMPEDSQIHKYKTAGKPESILLLADKVIKTFHFPIVTSGHEQPKKEVSGVARECFVRRLSDEKVM